ncbi:MAG: hypothetical protein AAF721_08950 [Myxococcota bacterium]
MARVGVPPRDVGVLQPHHAPSACAPAGTASQTVSPDVEALERRVAELERQEAPAQPSRDDELAELRLQVAAMADQLRSMHAALEDIGAIVPVVIGVRECDVYLARYERCIERRIPEQHRETTRAALRTAADAWRKAAEAEINREALAAACMNATDAVAKSCGW